MNTVLVLNSAIQLSDDDVAQIAPRSLWVRIAPATGEKSAATVKGQLVNQRFSPESNARVVANFSPEILVDREHNSLLTGDTTAYGWITKLENREDGLYAALNATDIGWDALRNRRLRFPSAVFTLDPEGFPLRLESLALTNRHNLKQLGPILNKDSAETGAAPIAANTQASATPTPSAQGEQMDKSLLALLGLADNADAPAVLNKVKDLATQVATLQTQLKELHTAALNKEAEDFVKANAAKIKDPAQVKAQYVLNKDAVVALFGAVADAPPAPHQVLNRADANQPTGPLALNAEAQGAAQRAAIDDAQRKYSCKTKAESWEHAKRDNPALFS